MPDLFVANKDGTGTSGTSMSCSQRSGASATTCGGQWIKMGTSLIFWSLSAETVEPLNDSFQKRFYRLGVVGSQSHSRDIYISVVDRMQPEILLP
jgi:hypothetical protein